MQRARSNREKVYGSVFINTHPPTTMTDITLPVIACPPDIQLITAETQVGESRTCRLYVLVEPTPHGLIVRYIGKTTQALCSRYGQHKRKARTDPLCAPLYRYAAALEHGNCLDNWEIRELYSFQYDPLRSPDAPVQLENYVYTVMRAAGYDLKQKSRPFDTNEQRRAYQREWHRAHPDYNRMKAVEHKERRRVRMEQQQAAAAAAMQVEG